MVQIAYAYGINAVLAVRKLTGLEKSGVRKTIDVVGYSSDSVGNWERTEVEKISNTSHDGKTGGVGKNYGGENSDMLVR